MALIEMFQQIFGKKFNVPNIQIGFIVGTGRCGSTILAQVLNSHSKIAVPPELQFIDKLYNMQLEKLTSEDIGQIIENYCPYNLHEYFDFKTYLSGLKYPQTSLSKLLEGLFIAICDSQNKSIFIEQTPWHGQHLPMIKDLFPEAKVIHIIRDPRDVVISFIRSKWWGEISIEEGMRKWRDIVKMISQWGGENSSSYLELRYEDLVLNPKHELTKVLRLVGTDYESGMLDPDRLYDYRPLQKQNTIALQSSNYQKWHKEKKQIFFRDGIQSWKNNGNNEFAPYIDEIYDVMKKYGYEK